MGKLLTTKANAPPRPPRPGRPSPVSGHDHKHQHIVVELILPPQLQQLLDSLLTQLSLDQTILKHIAQKVDTMALNFDKLNAAVTKLSDGQTALSASFDEIVKEFADLKAALADIPAAQEALNSFGDKLDVAATQIATQAQAFKDINPDTPAPPSPEASSRRRG